MFSRGEPMRIEEKKLIELIRHKSDLMGQFDFIFNWINSIYFGEKWVY